MPREGRRRGKKGDIGVLPDALDQSIERTWLLEHGGECHLAETGNRGRRRPNEAKALVIASGGMGGDDICEVAGVGNSNGPDREHW
jgi:hypothetical protein